MHITEEEYVPTFESLLHHEFSVIEYRVLLAAGPNPLSIEVSAYERAPIVPDNDPVRVKHGYDLEYERVPQKVRLVLIAYQIVYDPVHDQRGVGLPRMDPRCEDHGLPMRDRLRGRSEIRYY